MGYHCINDNPWNDCAGMPSDKICKAHKDNPSECPNFVRWADQKFPELEPK